ncbi:hypothetical protein Patl1_00548 [Pistacia atlantica]|uniref:Uncharacterized protein n=1 Tax=Pistacia atlantica TaxID=434234 RepID=A0ACC1C6G6_9ROSI|nr:hypothetical protein Patl1_00548 [Pistacia atlantica]
MMVIPPQMTVDQAKYPMMCGPWSNGSNCGHMTPCYACSNHGNFPVYYSFNPPTSHFTSSPCHHSCGHHPVFTAPYHVQYPFTPHHSMVQPRHDYDKEAQRDYHCCGCPNHICNQRSDRGVKIEEQEPDIARKDDSLVPINSKNNPYPVMWIPPEYMMKNYEYGRPLESEVADQKNASCNTKSHEDIKSSEKGPTVWNGWFPIDLNSLKPLMHDEDKERTDNQLNEDKMRQFPYPIIWMPSNDGKEEAQKDQRKDEWLVSN